LRILLPCCCGFNGFDILGEVDKSDSGMEKGILLAAFCIVDCYAVDIVKLPTALPEAKITASVTDENGTPISGVTVTVNFDKWIPFKDLEPLPVSGKTNGDGLYAAKGPSAAQRIAGSVEAPGYYRSTFASPLLQSGPNNTLTPWDPMIGVVLKKVMSPIPMYAKRVDTDVPQAGKRVGFDLLEGDWVAPYGKGKIADFEFKLTRRFASDRDFDCKLVLSFASQADGIQSWTNREASVSALKLPRLAPEKGYEQILELADKSTAKHFVNQEARGGLNSFFRVRTTVDNHGRVVSALYGKIDGDIRFSPIDSQTCALLFTYYLNPTVNDRNMEFDPKQNLLKGLRDRQQVSAP
jgi:hypothetical protein